MYKLDYIEFWATKHCNLNCKGCSSCSPVSEEWYLKPESIRKDLQRLKDLDIDIENINILGGEPLLHPGLEGIIAAVSSVCPEANIGVLTNGLLLLKQGDSFWEVCQRYKVKISMTCFPVMPEEVKNKIIDKITQHKIEYRITDKKRFNKILTLNNTDCIEDIQKACGCNHAYNLYDGMLARCTVPMAVEVLNQHFGVSFITEGKLDLYTATQEEVIRFLMTPNKSCLNCSAHPRKVPWEKADAAPKLSDWVLDSGSGPLKQ